MKFYIVSVKTDGKEVGAKCSAKSDAIEAEREYFRQVEMLRRSALNINEWLTESATRLPTGYTYLQTYGYTNPETGDDTISKKNTVTLRTADF